MAGGAAWGHAPSCLWGGVSLVKSIRRPIQAGRAANQATASVGRLATPPSAPRFRPKNTRRCRAISGPVRLSLRSFPGKFKESYEHTARPRLPRSGPLGKEGYRAGRQHTAPVKGESRPKTTSYCSDTSLHRTSCDKRQQPRIQQQLRHASRNVLFGVLQPLQRR